MNALLCFALCKPAVVRTSLILLLVLALAAVGGCQASSTATATPLVITIIVEQAITCDDRVEIMAWIDENTNGVWDEGETPLSGVEFHATGGNLHMIRVDQSGKVHTEKPVSNKEGMTYPYWIGTGKEVPAGQGIDSCDAAIKEILISPEIPPGYRLTTPLQQPLADKVKLGFGFVPINPTATPRP